jgi:hypothetical protein
LEGCSKYIDGHYEFCKADIVFRKLSLL